MLALCPGSNLRGRKSLGTRLVQCVHVCVCMLIMCASKLIVSYLWFNCLMHYVNSGCSLNNPWLINEQLPHTMPVCAHRSSTYIKFLHPSGCQQFAYNLWLLYNDQAIISLVNHCSVEDLSFILQTCCSPSMSSCTP